MTNVRVGIRSMRLIKLLCLMGTAFGATSGGIPPAAAATLTTLYSFNSYPGDGANPLGRLMYKAGILYGTTLAGGTYDSGTVFKIDAKTGAEVGLSSLFVTTGAEPVAGVIDYKGQLYTTSLSGGFGDGSVFVVDPKTMAATYVYQFGPPPDAAGPNGQLLNVKGEFYGVAQSGGANTREGAIYKIDPSTRTETICYSFGGGSDGDEPTGALIIKSGVVFGTTNAGGQTNGGTIYSFNITSGTEAVLYSFSGGSDGRTPSAGLIAVGKDLYGTTYSGGAAKLGTVFKFDPVQGKEKVLHSFMGGADGSGPGGDLLFYNGLIFGTTSAGGLGYGTVFSIDPKSGAETVLYSFTGGSDGAAPAAGLIQASGHLFGTTKSGGATQNGTVFQFDP